VDAPGLKRCLTCGAIGLLLAAVGSGCGGRATVPVEGPSESAQRAVAGRFATALLRADLPRARALLVHPDEEALVFLVRRAVAHWTHRRATIHLPARRAGRRWTVRYDGRRAFRDGRFETERGAVVVLVGRSRTGRARVRFFAFTQVERRFSTHQDAELLPSKR
jgi:hypothetical protein